MRIDIQSVIMSTKNNQFTAEQLQQIDRADDLKISPFREDGKTYGTPTWIWVVVVDGGLYVRAYNGVNSRWYQAAINQGAGRIYAAGMMREVKFEPVTWDMNPRIDAAYRAKYKSSQYLAPMLSTKTKAATIKIVPTIPSEKFGKEQ